MKDEEIKGWIDLLFDKNRRAGMAGQISGLSVVIDRFIDDPMTKTFLTGLLDPTTRPMYIQMATPVVSKKLGEVVEAGVSSAIQTGTEEAVTQLSSILQGGFSGGTKDLLQQSSSRMATATAKGFVFGIFKYFAR